MLSPSGRLHLCRDLISQMIDWHMDGGAVQGRVRMTDQTRPLLIELEREGSLVPTFEVEATENDVDVEIEFSVPRSQIAFFAASLDDLLLSFYSAKYAAPREVYFADGDELCGEGLLPVRLDTQRYYRVLSAISLLEKAADYRDDSSGSLRLIIIGKERLDIPVAYSREDLTDFPSLDKWMAMLDENVHLSQRKAILKTVVSDALKGIAEARRFRAFLGIFEDLYKSFENNYQLYVSEFSFEKVKNEIREKRIDYAMKLNKSFSDIQNQLLAIPVAVVLVGAQLESAKGVTIKNSFVVAGAFVFAFLMSLLLRNQGDNVGALASEVRLHLKALSEKYSALAEELDESYKDLARRERRQRRLLRCVDALVALALLFTVALFLHRSDLLLPAFHGLRDLVNF